MAKNYYIFGGIFMKFKNGFKVGMVIASPIVLMSTYAAPCFAEGTSVSVTNLNATNISMEFTDSVVDVSFSYGSSHLPLRGGPSNDYTLSNDNKTFTFTSNGLKKIT